ncbi:hypothetical protein IC582_025923 [Cucumis melo]
MWSIEVKNVKDRNEERKKILSKVIWYFPPIPRFKRLFRSIECAENLTWHASERIEDGKLRHPADSPAWKLVDFKWPDFGSEPRNLRLALSADGVNPHGDMSSKYSCWPIVMVIYNLPPWLCMKRKYMMLSMLISGLKQLGDDIGTYLAPLIEDLELLWENGVECYDAYREEVFNLRSVLLWTINDFSAYGNLSGYCVKGYKACPICGDNTNSIRLRHGKKIAYLGHRRFLARHHPYRRQKKSFNGKKELGTIPEPLSGEDVYLKLKDLEFPKGKKIHKNLSMNRSEKICWNRLSSFFEFSYWKDLHVRHCLDVMHIKKNVCMNILGTLLDIPGKSKDGLNARRDLVDLKLRPELSPISSEKKIFIPPACYTLTKEEKRCVLKTLSRIKVPEGYFSNIRNLVSMTDLKLNSLKSHDCHVLIQQLFPVAIRSMLSKHVRYAITRLCIFFNSVCNKVLDAQQLDKLEEDIVVSTELEVGNSGVSDNLRWIAHGPHPFVDEISMNTDSSFVNRHCSNDVLTQALGTKEHNGRVREVGGYVTPTTYFHSVKKSSKDEANILVENEELRRRVSELETQIRSNLSTPLSAHGSCSRPIVLEGIEEKGKRIEVESLDKPKQKEKKGKEVIKMNEPELDVLERDLIKMPTKKEVVCESTSTLPLALKSILRYAEKVMEKDSSITFSLSADLFGVSRKTSVLREDIVDLCNMNEVKTFTLVAYMMYLYSSVSGSKENMQYVFVDLSLISSGNTQESRIRNLCSRLMVPKPDQVILAPFNPG